MFFKTSSIISRIRFSQLLRGGDHHHHYKGYNEPGGYFLGIPPAPKGYRRKRLDFENMYLYLYGGSWLAFLIAMYYRPPKELESWAHTEALIRMKERGENWDTPGKPY
jgi:hypothetical protein